MLLEQPDDAPVDGKTREPGSIAIRTGRPYFHFSFIRASWTCLAVSFFPRRPFTSAEEKSLCPLRGSWSPPPPLVFECQPHVPRRRSPEIMSAPFAHGWR